MERHLNLTLSVHECGVLLAALIDEPLMADESREDRAILLNALTDFVCRENDRHSVRVGQLSIMQAALHAAERAM